VKRLAILDAHVAPDNFLDCAEAMCREANVSLKVLECRTADAVVAGAHDCDAALCCFVPVDASVLSRLPKLRMVVRVGIGVDNFNLDDFTRCGVFACNTPDYGIEEVAVHSLALMLALERNIVRYARATRQGAWAQGVGREMRRLSHRTLGLIGFGRIARKLATLAAPLGYSLVAFDPYVCAAECAGANAHKVEIEELFRRADIIVVLAPATGETRHIVNANHLGLARDGLLLVNTSRGSLVDTGAVAEALRCGKLHGAALDVLEEEPPSARSLELLEHDAVILTPHIAYRSQESLAALNRLSVQTALDYLCGNTIRNLVNKAALRA
jgi:D-3-phosphoglycerate dehydrogenase